MRTRVTHGLAAVALSVLLVGCGDSPPTEPSNPIPQPDLSIPSGESVAELQAEASRELERLEAGELRVAAAAPSGGKKTIVEIASETPDLSILVQAVVRAGLVDALNAPGARTVLAPTNDAFVALLGRLGLGSLEQIPIATLQTVLLSHVIPKVNIRTDFFRPLDWLDIRSSTLGPITIEYERADRARAFTVNGIDIVAGDIRASNGLIHVIDQVLPVPDSRPTIVEAAVALAGQGQFTALVAAVVKTGLVDALANENANLTVFAPTDAAFARLGLTAASINALTDPAQIDGLRAVLLDHVVGHEFSKSELRVLRFLRPLGKLLLRIQGDVASVNGIRFVALDAVDARNGVIHVIDGVLVK